LPWKKKRGHVRTKAKKKGNGRREKKGFPFWPRVREARKKKKSEKCQCKKKRRGREMPAQKGHGSNRKTHCVLSERSPQVRQREGGGKKKRE